MSMLRDLRGKLPLRYPDVPVEPVAFLPFYAARDPRWIDTVYLHYTASPTDTTVESIARYQTGPGAQEVFPAIAYHVVVDGDGMVNICHDLATRTWQCTGRNWTGAAVCYTGDVEPSAIQLVGLKIALEWVFAQLGRSVPILPHLKGSQTSCPGPKWEQWFPLIMPDGAT